MKVGDTVPDFELKDETGTARRLSELLTAGPVVLFFFPMASSPGCTRESCHFRDLAKEFQEAGAQRVGISGDAVEKQKKFADANTFDFPLLSDPQRTVAREFGVRRPLGLPVKRRTFVIDTDRKVLEVISSETNMSTHADRALQVLRAR